MPWTYAELFAGAGGLSMGLEAAGFHAAAHAEIEPHAQAVLRHHWPNTRLDGDVTQIDGRDYAGVTLLSGGSPCQDLSVAGKRAGLAGARSGLFYEQVRIWEESEAPYLLWENVLGALSSNKGQDFAAVLSALVGAPVAVPADGWRSAGVAAGATGVAAWRVSDLQHFGPPQRRRRVFVFAARTGGVDPAEVLALGEGVCGHPSPRSQAREGAARGAAGGAGGGDVAINLDGEKNAHVELIGTLNTGRKSGSGQQPTVLAFHSKQDPISGAVSPALGRTTEGMGVICTTGQVTHALTHEGADASEDGTGRGTPIVAFSRSGFGDWAENEAVTALCARDHEDQSSLVLPNQQWPKPIADTLTVAYAEKLGFENQHINSGAVLFQMTPAGRPRRLTPKECERLMSWPDDHTRYGTKDDGTVYELSDTARYRLCGNGVGSVQVQWIAERLMAALQQA
jgi:DNA (cytosine-5)-methyltransferase 1